MQKRYKCPFPAGHFTHRTLVSASSLHFNLSQIAVKAMVLRWE